MQIKLAIFCNIISYVCISYIFTLNSYVTLFDNNRVGDRGQCAGDDILGGIKENPSS